MKSRSLRLTWCTALAIVALALVASRAALAIPPAPEHVATAPAAEAAHDAAAHVSAPADEHAPAAHSAGGHDEGSAALMKPDFVSMGFTIAIFVALVVVLRFTAWKPILQGLKSREESIRNSIEAAAKAKADAEKSTRELEARVAEVQRQAAQQLQQAKADAQKLADGIKAQAESESIALKDRALRDIEAAKGQALAEINAHAAELGVAVARKILQRNITAEDHSRLVEESLTQLGTTKV